jgi:hypothetical protein
LLETFAQSGHAITFLEERTVKKRVWPSQVISSSSRSGQEGNTRVVMGNIGLLSQKGRKDDGEVLLYFITFQRFTESETEPLDNRDLQFGLSPKNGTHDISTAGDLPLYLLQNQTKGV